MNYVEGVRSAYAKILLIFSKYKGTFGLTMGVGGSLGKMWVIFQKYDEFGIVSKPKVLPPTPCLLDYL